MALINCPECGGKVSDRAEACPHCGCSNEHFGGTLSNSTTNNNNDPYSKGEYYFNQNDVNSAIDQYLIAARLNNPKAMYKLALCYEKYNDVETALYWYDQASQFNHIDAMIAIGDYYRNAYKESVMGDVDFYYKAKDYYEKAIELNAGIGYGRMGLLMYDPVNSNNPKHPKYEYTERVLYYFRKGSELGNASASYWAAHIYEKNAKLQNFSEAIKLYKLAIEQCEDSVDRCIYKNTLGFRYSQGKIVTQDYDKAEELYLSALEDYEDETVRKNLEYLREKKIFKEKCKCPNCGNEHTVAIKRGVLIKKEYPNERHCNRCNTDFKIE